jgi:hypothetical protein
VEPLKVDDVPFLVSSTIERCPKVMMPRELMRNALEAAEQAPPGNQRIEIRAITLGNHQKLAFWNTGPGMNAFELHRMCDLAASIGKSKGLDQNFGMGAKVASLPSNKRGMRYRSCKGGTVNEVIIGNRDGIYGRFRRELPDTGEVVEVVDITGVAAGEGYDLSTDWTEVVLLGNNDDQDTVLDPYDSDPKTVNQWLADYLYHRFYRFPEGIRVLMKDGTHKLTGDRQFKTIDQRRRDGVFSKEESVQTNTGIVVHYIYDEPYHRSPSHNRSIGGALQTDASTCAIVFKDELYDIKRGKTWTQDAPIFGIPFGARHISIHVELPETYPVIPEGYRQNLRYQAGPQDRVMVADFANLVALHRPEWIKELIKRFAPDSVTSDEIRDELQRLLDRLRIRRSGPRPALDGLETLTAGSGAGSQMITRGAGGARGDFPRTKSTDLTALPSGARRASIYDNLERAPQIVPLSDPEDIDEKNIRGRAGRYYNEQNQLFVNLLYPAVAEMREVLEAEYASASEPEAMRLLASQQSEHQMVLRVGRAVVYALAKKLSREWDREAVERAMSPESLSVAADDYTGSLQSARRSMGIRLRAARQEVVADETV